jgi:Cys-tRNA synthase (O-phospho-L-seryl-tRNA:Cys-tRNA synthase)
MAKRKPKKEMVNHPSHYGGDTTYEAKKVIRAWGLGFGLGSAAKYICRAGKKVETKEAQIEDLEKAVWYLQDEIRFLKTGEL